MPRILRSPGRKSFRVEKVSVPNADGARSAAPASRRPKTKSALGSNCVILVVGQLTSGLTLGNGHRQEWVCHVSNVPTGDMEFASINERGRQLRRS